MSHSNQTNYEPEVDDYVIWNRPNGDIEEGWVYFKGDPVDNEKRIKDKWNPVSRYITIETNVEINQTVFILLVNQCGIKRFIHYYYVMNNVGMS